MKIKTCVACGKEFKAKIEHYIICPRCWVPYDEDDNWTGQSCNEVDDCGDRD